MVLPEQNATDAVPALAVQQLSAGYRTAGGAVTQVVRDVSFSLQPGEILGMAGESGCGKSTVSLAAMGFQGQGVTILGGSSLLAGQDLLAMPPAQRRRLWGQQISYVPQNAGTALNPSYPIGRQLSEPLRTRLGLRGAELRARRLELLDSVQLPAAESVLRRYPHQFSGGQLQRVAIALALAARPAVLLLDEPTTGLDAATQTQISALLRQVVQEHQMSALYVSHDLSLLADVADRLAVMYAGQVVEHTGERVRRGTARHPYTQALLAALPDPHSRTAITGIVGSPPASALFTGCGFAPRCAHVQEQCLTQEIQLENVDARHQVRCRRVAELPPLVISAAPAPPARASAAALLSVQDLTVRYHGAAQDVLRGVSLHLAAGETLGVLGESGSGKSTLLRALAGLHPATSGQVTLDGDVLAAKISRRSRQTKRRLQIVFQNPDSALNPRHTVDMLVRRPVRIFRDDVPRDQELAVVRGLLDAVKLPQAALHRYPAELSGGQKQRVALARAFATRPQILLCDEVTSALDVSVQATVVELIADLSREFDTAVVFVSHDLGLVRSICDRVMVMRHGEVCEEGGSEAVFASPRSDYTRELLDAFPVLA